MVDTNAFVKGSWGAEIVADMAPQPGDIVLEGKRGLDAFASTNLDFILRSKGIETVALGGFLTNCCVESTMRSAYEKGFEVVTLTDCVGATSAEEHANAITYDYPMFSKPMTAREFADHPGGRGDGGRLARLLTGQAAPRDPSVEPRERVVVIVIGEPGRRAWGRLRDLAPRILCVRADEADATVMERADAVFAWDFRSGSLRELWPRLPHVAWVHAASAGVDHLPLPELVERATIVTNSAGVFDRSIAEYVLGLILLHAKGFDRTLAAQAERRWAYRETSDVLDKRLLVVGLGRIGRTVARLASAVGLHVEAVRRDGGSDPDVAAVHPASALADVVGDADFVAITVARTPETHHLVDARVLAAMKPEAYLVNVARGDVVDTDALATALRSGRLAGAALDVFETEPLPPGDPLWDTPNLLVSPHMCGDATGWEDRVIDVFIENARRFLAGMPLRNQVDLRRGY